jgi:uncharacterized membrane protein YfcA
VLISSLLWSAAAAFSAGVLSGFTGFGLAAVVVPLLLVVHEPETVVALVAVLSLSVAAAVVRDSWREADRRVALALLVPALPGLALGAEVLRVVDPAYIRLAMGALVTLAAISLLREDVRLPGAQTLWASTLTGLVSGILASSTGLSGPPAVLLFASRGFAKHAFRASISMYFLGLDLALLVVLGLWGFLQPSLAPLALLLVGATLAGKALGTALFRRASQRTFRAVVLGTVVLMGVLGTATAARAVLY